MEQKKKKKGFGPCPGTDPGWPSKQAVCAGARDSKSRSGLAAQDAWHARAWPRERAGRWIHIQRIWFVVELAMQGHCGEASAHLGSPFAMGPGALDAENQGLQDEGVGEAVG
jgi:nitrous oxide reductase accessory protein NosL